MNTIVKNSIFGILIFSMFLSCRDEELVNKKPSIEDQTFTVQENARVGTFIGTIVASDEDGDNLSYAISIGNDEGAFQIDETNGEITVAYSEPLDFDLNESFRMVVTVKDKDLSSWAVITINYSDEEVDAIDGILDLSNFNLEYGLVKDYGIDDIDTHYNYDFSIADSPFEEVTDELGSYYDCGTCKALVYCYLISPGTSNFTPGTFEYIDFSETLYLEDLVDKFIIASFNIALIDDEDVSNIVFYGGISGTIKVIENSNLNYTITFDQVVQQVNIDTNEFMEDAEKISVSFTYTGNFIYSNQKNLFFSEENKERAIDALKNKIKDPR